MSLPTNLAVGIWLALATLSGAATIPPPRGTAPEYRIRAGDALSVKFFYNSDLSEEVTVRPDGRISLQLIPEVMAAGRTPAGLVDGLREQYATELERPEIAVIVRSFSAHRVYVDGEVARPGEIPLVRPLTVLQAIYLAGGVTVRARPKHVLLIRREPDRSPRVFELNLKKAGDRAPADRDIALQPLDVVYVPTSSIARVNGWVDHYVKKNIPVPFGFKIEID